MREQIRILHIALQLQGADQVELRFFWDNPLDYQKQHRSLSVIQQQVQRSEERYYTRCPEDHVQIGQDLYRWLDGSERRLKQALDQYPGEALVLAISAAEGLAHLPWEVLHDGQHFLVERRIVPVRWVQAAKTSALTLQQNPQNRALNVLFMATSPRGIQPELDFEKEEGAILSATRGKAYLRVEESGCLEELRGLRQEYEPEFFDVAHLSGHAGWEEDQPYFLTETVYGDPVCSRAEDLCEALWCEGWPELIFLSGCRTGYASGEGSIPSLAQQLLMDGANAVLGWGQRVLDLEAATGAQSLYEELSNGAPLWEAMSATYRSMIQAQARDWHHLRLYVRSTLPGALVTRKNTKGRQPIPVQTQTGSGFRDDQRKLRVATREEFVGRRRQLQNCLRALKKDPDKIGVVIHGMGGLGKSTIASRLWDRLPEHEKLYWWRQIDEGALTNELSEKLSKPYQQELRDYLQDPRVSLSARLIYIFQSLSLAGERPFLLVLDDFEWNLDPVQGHYVLQPQVVAVLEALVTAIQQTPEDKDHRILITCRYKFESELSECFYFQALDSLHGSDLQKKLKRLQWFQSEDLAPELINRALKLADGNPRLLEWLNEVLGQTNAEEQLAQFEGSSESWKEKVIWPDLCQQIDGPLEQILSRCLVYKLLVPMHSLEAVCHEVPDHRKQLQRAIGLGLLEVSSDQQEYKVSWILPRILLSVCLPQETGELSDLYQHAWEGIEKQWGNTENNDIHKWRELFRLLFGITNNPRRFRKGFSYMLASLNNTSDRAFRSELAATSEELHSDSLLSCLEENLRKGDWKAADEETSWIFYEVMAVEKFEVWEELLRNFPRQTLESVDSLWCSYSNGRFGFNAQKKQYFLAGGKPGVDNKNAFKIFECKVGWRDQNTKRTYNEIDWSHDAIINSKEGYLPVLCLATVYCSVLGHDWRWARGVSLISESLLVD